MSLVASFYVGPPKHAAVPAMKTTATTIALTHKRQRVAGSQDQQLSRAASTINPPQQRSCRQLSSVMPTVRFKALLLSDTVAVNNIRTTIATTQILSATAAATTTITTAETAANHKLNPLPNAKNHHSKYQSYVTITTTAKSAPTRYGDETLTQRRTAEMLLAAAKERAFLGGETPAQRTAARANLINYNLNGLMGDAKLVCDKQTICKCQQQQQRPQRRWAAAMKQQREVVSRKGTTRDVPAAATGALTAATARTMTKIDRLTHYPYRDKDYEKRGLAGAALAIATITTARHLLHIVRKLCLVLALLLSILTLQHANCQQLMPAANKTATIATKTAAVVVDGTATVTATTTTTTSTAISVLQATIKTPTTMATAAFKKRAYTFLRAREEHLSSSSTNNLTTITKTTQTEAHDHHRKPAPLPTKHGLTAATNFDHKADIVALELVRPAASSIKQQRTNGKSEEKKQFQIKEEEQQQKLQEVKEDEKVERRQVQEQEQLQEEEEAKQLQKEEQIIEEEHKQQQLASQLLQSGALQTPNETRANKHDQQRPNAATVDNNDNAAIINSNVMTDNYKTANNIASGQLQLQFVQQRKDTQQQKQAEQAIEASVSSDIVTSHQPLNYDFTKNASSQATFASALTQRVAENHQNTPHQINATYAHSLIVFSNLIHNQTNSRNIIHNHNSNNLIITTTTAATSAALYDNAQHLHSNAQQLSDAQNEDHDNNNNNSAVANVEVDIDDIDVDAADVAFMSKAPVAFKLAHSNNNNNNNNNTNHLIEHKTASHRHARAAAVDVADVAVNVNNASANDNDGEVAQPNSFTDYEDNRKLLRLVMDGLGLRKLPDMTKVNISQLEYATKYREYLRRVHERKRRELADLVQPFGDGDWDAPLQIVSIVTNASELVPRPRRKRDMHASIDAADAASMDAALTSATNFSQPSTRLRQHYTGARTRRRHNEKLLMVLHFPLNVDAGQLQPGDIEEANIRLMIIHSAALAKKHNNNNKHKNKSKLRPCGKAKQTSGGGGGVRQKHVLNLKVYQRLQAGKRLWLDGRKLDIVLDPSSSADDTHSQWLQFDVTRAVETWLRERHTNLGLEVQCDNCHRIGARILNDVSTPLGYDANGYQLMPVLNIIGHLGVTYQEIRTRKHSNSADTIATAAHAHHHNVAGTLNSAQRPAADRHICRKANQRCCRHTMEVVFKEIKGFEFIIQPKVFDAGYCHGRCPPRFNPAHHHAMLQSLIWKQNRERAPRPCCAPSKLVELEVLHVDEKDSKKLKISTWTDMRVVECACS